jgi:hypothetical protein
MFLLKKITQFSSWLLGGVKLRYKSIIIVLCALFGGHLCDTHYELSFPFFKIAFTCVSFIIVTLVQEIENGEEESQK